MTPSLIRFSSDTLPRGLSAQQWREGLLHQLHSTFGHAFEVGPSSDLVRGRIGMTVSVLGPARLGRVEASAGYSASRTRTHLRLDDADSYRVFAAISGEFLISQDGRTSRLSPGGFAVLDYSRPYEARQISADVAYRHAVIHLPRSALPFRPKDVEKLSAAAIPGGQDAGGLLVATLDRVTRDFGKYQAATLGRASAALVDLLTAALSEQLEEPPEWSPESRNRAVLLRVRAFIEQHLGDADLSTTTIAAAHHLSERQLQRLFAEQQITVHGFIRQRRLERCRADLAEPALRHQSVSAIGARWGFPDSAHFSRLFHRTFGETPTGSRHLVVHGQPDGAHAQE
ncbi:helix-turn-helix domain-containing protein [Nonomuraea sp. NPDC050556]|uniref:helix-turn-helix domain-containing protein n=1 Tax=Nonomuraea sp. NPDC050556 TaxID=3364369 RepID=UPI0037AA5512